jgi:putative transposase
MAIPARNASSEAILSSERVFFATTKTSAARRILQSDRNAMLLIEVLRSHVAARKFQLHDFVIMPNHLHLLVELPNDISIERAMQLVKGGFSYRLRKDYGSAARFGNADFLRCGSAIGKPGCNVENTSSRTL